MLLSVCLESESAGRPILTYSTIKCPKQRQRPARGISTINLARVQCQPHSSIARMRGYMPAGDVNRSTQATRTLARETLTPAGRGQVQVICYCNEWEQSVNSALYGRLYTLISCLLEGLCVCVCVGGVLYISSVDWRKGIPGKKGKSTHNDRLEITCLLRSASFFVKSSVQCEVDINLCALSISFFLTPAHTCIEASLIIWI